MAIFKGFGFIDLISLILCLGISYAAVSKGIFVEILKIFALFINSVFTFQLYPFIAEKISNKIPFLSKDYTKVVTFVALFFIVWIIFGLLIKTIDKLFKRKEIFFAEKLLALVLGFLRFVFLASIVVFFIYLLPVKPAFLNGYTSRIFKNIAPKVYLVTAGIFNKVNPELSINAEVKKVYEIKNDLSGDSKEGN